MILLFLMGCGEETSQQRAIEKSYAIQLLHDETYIMPARRQSESPVVYLPLEPFDIIFAGHDYNSTYANIAYATPGHFTHALLYLGKDSEGFAYGVEINTDGQEEYHFDASGLTIGGQLFIYCLGSDYGIRACREDLYIHGLETYDFLYARRLVPSLRNSILQHRQRLLQTIRNDLQNHYPAQLPFHIGPETALTQTIPLVDDGRANGADCTSYIVSLFEEEGTICLEDVWMDAKEIERYYRNDPRGQKAILSAEYNPFSNKDIPFATLFGSIGYHLSDPLSVTSGCNRKQGIPIPDKLYQSPSMQEIPPIAFSTRTGHSDMIPAYDDSAFFSTISIRLSKR